MGIGKLIWHNIIKTISDYVIYWLFDVIIVILLFSGNVLDSLYKDIISVNSLPLIILLVAFSVLLYINKQIINKRGKEFALYMLSGLNKSHIIIIYTAENIGILILACIAGIPLGICYSLGIMMKESETVHYFNVIYSTFQTTVVYLAIVCLSVIFISVYCIWKNDIKSMMLLRKKVEIGNRKYSIKKTSAIFVIFLFFFCISLKYAEQMISAIFLSATGIVYIANRLIMENAYRIREKRLYFMNNDWIYIWGKLLAKCKSKLKIYVVMNICFMISVCSFTTGYVFRTTENVIIDLKLDNLMGNIQIYIAILFLVIIYSVINISQSMELIETKRDYYILGCIGREEKRLKSIIMKEIGLNCCLAIFTSILVLILSCFFIVSIVGRSVIIVALLYIFFCIALFSICEMLLYCLIKKPLLKNI